MKRPLFIFLAVGLFLFYSYGFLQWLRSGHDFGDVWRAISSDWFLAVTVLDLCLFGLLCLVWLYLDMRKRRYGGGKMALILLAVLLTGVVTVLLYLAFRDEEGLTGKSENG